MNEDETFRILRRIPFADMSVIIHNILLNARSPAAISYSTTQAYKENGWTRPEFHAEMTHRAN